jgi:hypothetical protein
VDKDLAHILGDWEYDSNETVRFIKGDDGRQILQVRLPLGIEQYELDGRPDGLRPFGRESALDEIENRLKQFIAEHGEDGGFNIDHNDFLMVQNEGILYYYRYLLLFQIGDYERTAQDTNHNLRLCSMVEKYCTNKEDQRSLLQYKPYIVRVNALSRAMLHLSNNDKPEALSAVESAIDIIKTTQDVSTSVFKFERDRSLDQLKKTLVQINDFKVGTLEQLESELEQAIENEDYEAAVELRDKISHYKERGQV